MDNIFTYRANKSKILPYVSMVSNIYTIEELIKHPELFDSMEEYDEFVSSVRKKDKFDWFLYESLFPTVQRRLHEQLSNEINSQIGQFIYSSPLIINDFNTISSTQDARRSLADAQTNQLIDFIQNRRSWLQDKSVGMTNKQIHAMMLSHRKQLRDLVSQQYRQQFNFIQHQRELVTDPEHRHDYKTWIWTPNPKTRHTGMADRTVELEEKFNVVSDQDQCPDCEMDFPLDPGGTICQKAHCKCSIVYSHDKRKFK